MLRRVSIPVLSCARAREDISSPSTGLEGSKFPAAKATVASAPLCSPLPALCLSCEPLEPLVSSWAQGGQAPERLLTAPAVLGVSGHMPGFEGSQHPFLSSARQGFGLISLKLNPSLETLRLPSISLLPSALESPPIFCNFPGRSRQAGQRDLETAVHLGSPNKP